VVVSHGDEQVADRVEYKCSGVWIVRLGERRAKGFAVLVLISWARAARRAMLAKWRRPGRTMMEKLGKFMN